MHMFLFWEKALGRVDLTSDSSCQHMPGTVFKSIARHSTYPFEIPEEKCEVTAMTVDDYRPINLF
jgi:hypothetical protein